MVEAIEIDKLHSQGGNVLNLNRSRMRAIYYRKIGDDWLATQPLPADPFSITYYFSKGFKAKPPGGKVVDAGTVSCPFCEFTTKSAFGLQSHLRKHIRKEEKP